MDNKPLLVLKNLKDSYLVDQENILNKLNYKLKTTNIFPTSESELKTLMNELSIISVSLEQVNHFIKLIENGNNNKSGVSDSASD